MRLRGLAILVAVLLAIGATGAVYLYVQGVREDAVKPPEMVSVIVSKEDIPVGTNLDDLIQRGAFTTISIPADAVIQGAVTGVSQIEGEVTRYPILQGEQISTARLQEGSIQPEGGVLGLPEGHKAVTLPIAIPQAVGGVLQRGDRITIYATFEGVNLLTPSLREIIDSGGDVESKKHELGDFTVTVVPQVEVLKVAQPGSGGVVDPDGVAQITLALTPADAQSVVYAQEKGKIWFALLRPDEKGTREPPSNSIEAILR